MRLEDAQFIAHNTMIIVEDVCERVEIAGSVRRNCAICNDVDLVCIPKFKEHRDLFGALERRENLLRTRLCEYVKQNRPRVIWAAEEREGAKGTPVEPKDDGLVFSVKGQRSQVDFFVADENTWATTLLTRTGSKEHNIWIAQRALAGGGQFKASVGLIVPGRGLVHPKSEEEFYELLGLPFVQPRDRHVPFLERIAKEVSCR